MNSLINLKFFYLVKYTSQRHSVLCKPSVFSLSVTLQITFPSPLSPNTPQLLSALFQEVDCILRENFSTELGL